MIAKNCVSCHVVAAWLTLLCGAALHACEVEYRFAVPSDDRWHYPFNFTPGFRAVASCFGAPDIPGFNDRDGCFIVGWETDSQIQSEMDPGQYEIVSVSVVLTNLRGAQWPIDLTVDEWSTYAAGGFDPDPGRPTELFGVGFGPNTEEAVWMEDEFFYGSTSEDDVPRDPFPFVYQSGTLAQVHVEDNVKGLHNQSLMPRLCSAPSGPCPFTPQPWAIGIPQGYVPGNQTVPFEMTFDVDLTLSGGAVRRYFQQQLSNGRILIYVTSLRETQVMGPQAGFPAFFTREGVPLDPNAKAPTLVVRLRTVGDWDKNGRATVSDWPGLSECLSGPDQSISTPELLDQCLCTFDLDEDGDVDLWDAAEWELLISAQ